MSLFIFFTRTWDFVITILWRFLWRAPWTFFKNVLFREIELEMSERATRVGVKVKPPTLIVIYSVHLDKIQNRIRKIPLKVSLFIGWISGNFWETQLFAVIDFLFNSLKFMLRFLKLRRWRQYARVIHYQNLSILPTQI